MCSGVYGCRSNSSCILKSVNLKLSLKSVGFIQSSLSFTGFPMKKRALTCNSLQNPVKIEFDDVIKGVLIKRYKRFLADVSISDESNQNNNTLVTAHTPNPGRMTGYADPNTPVVLTKSNNPNRKLKYTWQVAYESNESELIGVGVNTQNANALIEQLLKINGLPGFEDYTRVQREVSNVYKKDPRSRVDFMITNEENLSALVEVKSVTMKGSKDGITIFPDCVSKRARNHILSLAESGNQSMKSILVFCVQRSDAKVVIPAWEIDVEFCTALQNAVESNLIQVFAYQAIPSDHSILLTHEIPFFVQEHQAMEYLNNTISKHPKV